MVSSAKILGKSELAGAASFSGFLAPIDSAFVTNAARVEIFLLHVVAPTCSPDYSVRQVSSPRSKRLGPDSYGYRTWLGGGDPQS
jgi:hypothetical protein